MGGVDFLRMIMGWWSGEGSPEVTGTGRVEFTVPRMPLEFAFTYQPTEFTLPKTVDEFEVGSP